jgi:hypothetical protein
MLAILWTSFGMMVYIWGMIWGMGGALSYAVLQEISVLWIYACLI